MAARRWMVPTKQQWSWVPGRAQRGRWRRTMTEPRKSLKARRKGRSR